MATTDVPTFDCLGGCGRTIDAEAHPTGFCRSCEERRPLDSPDHRGYR